MSNFLYPVLNGIAPSWADIQVRLTPQGGALIEMGDIAGLSGGPSLSVGHQKEGGRIVARTTGEVSNEASMTLYMSGFRKLLRGLKGLATLNQGKRQISLVPINVNILWTPPGSDDIFERRWKGARYLGGAIDAAEGTDAQQVVCPFDVLEICDVIDGEEIVLI